MTRIGYFSLTLDGYFNPTLIPTLLPTCDIIRVGNKGGNKNHEYSLNRTQVRILAEIRNNPNITKARLMELLGFGKTTIDRGLSVLKKYGYIERVGSRKAGYWKVHED